MSASGPGDRPNPMENMLRDLLKLFGAAGAAGATPPWTETARALAVSTATDNEPEDNPDPLVRIRLDELARVAELHVAETTGLSVGRGDRPVAFAPLGRGAWALAALDAYRPLVDVLARAIPAAPTMPPLGADEDDEGAVDLAQILSQFSTTLGPVLVGAQFGSAIGRLARTALGQYALPVPWPADAELAVVPRNIAAFAEDWSLDLDQTELWVCVHELTAHAVLGRPHVAERLGHLLREAAAEAGAASQDLADRLGGLGGTESLTEYLGDPEALMSELLPPARRSTSAQLSALTTTVGAYVDHVTATVAARLTGTPGPLTEAWYRYRVSESEGEQAAGDLFGLDLGREQVDRGAAFVRGVLERAGEEGLARLWSTERTLPTPAEVDAPGLWLERIDLPDVAGD